MLTWKIEDEDFVEENVEMEDVEFVEEEEWLEYDGYSLLQNEERVTQWMPVRTIQNILFLNQQLTNFAE